MPVPTLNLLAEVLQVEEDLQEKQRKLDRLKKNPIGRLPMFRATLNSRQILLDCAQIKIDAAKEYLNAIAAREK